MTSRNVSEALRKKPPSFKVQIALTGNQMVLCFSEQGQAQEYFESLGQNSGLDPIMSVDGLEVSISLQGVQWIELGKDPNRSFRIKFQRYSAAREWLQSSNLHKLLKTKRGEVVIAESNPGPTGGEKPPQQGTPLSRVKSRRRERSNQRNRSNQRMRPNERKGIERSDSLTDKIYRGFEKLTRRGSTQSNDG